MKPHPKLRRTIKWCGAAVTLPLAVAWIGSIWIDIEWHSSDMSSGFGLFANSWFFERSSIPLWAYQKLKDGPVPGFAFRREPGFGIALLPSTFEISRARTVYIPTWMPAAIAFVPTLIAWRLDAIARRRARLNLCSKCDYNRAGIAPDAKCPECGAPPANG